MKTFITLKKPIIKYLLYWTPAILIFIFTSILLLGKALNFTPGLALLSEVIIAKELEFDNHSNIKINSGLMWLDGKALTINLDQIEIIYDERYKITIPQVKLTFNISKIFSKEGSFIKSFSISHDIKVNKMASSYKYKNSNNALSLKLIHSNIIRHLSDLDIVNILKGLTLEFDIMNDKALEITFTDVILNIESTRQHSKKINLALDLEINKKNSRFIGELDVSDSSMKLDAKLENVNSITLNLLSFFNIHFYHAFLNSDLNLDFTISADSKTLEKLDFITFEAHTANGYINPNDWFHSTLIVQDLLMKGECLDNCKDFKINDIKLVTPDFTMTGEINNQDDKLGNFFIEKIKIQEVYKYWPDVFAKSVKTWLLSNMNSGIATNINANFDDNFQEDDRHFNVNFSVNNTKINYMDKIPPLVVHKANININKDGLHIDVTDANLSNASISGLNGYYTFIEKEMAINGKLKGPIQDFIDIGFLHGDLNNSDLRNFNGDVESALKLKLDFNKQISLDSLNLDMESKVKNLSNEKFLQKYSIDKGNMKIAIKEQVLSVNGDAVLNKKLPIKIFIQNALKENSPLKGEVTLKAIASQIREAGFALPESVENTVGLKMEFNYDKLSKNYNCEFDLENASIYDEILGIKKIVGIPGKLSLNLNTSNGDNYTINYSLALPTVKSSGDGNFSDSILEMNSKNTTISQSTFSYQYKRLNDDVSILLNGNSLDFSNINFAKIKNISQGKVGSFTMKTKVNSIVFKNNMILLKPTLNVEYSKQMEKLHLSGDWESGGNIKIIYNYPALIITSEDAGKSLRAFDIYSNMNNGLLNLKGNFSQDKIFSGDFLISKFYIIKAQILTKLFSITSITSLGNIIDLLNGKGLSFSKLSCELLYKGKKMQLNSCVQEGPSVKITGNGIIETDSGYLYFRGFLSSVSIVNKVIKNIPLIGKALSGSHSGRSNFIIEGHIGKNIDIKTSHLSILIPGFISRFFDLPNNDKMSNHQQES